jgi:polysaccharide biosynthesis protein PelD
MTDSGHPRSPPADTQDTGRLTAVLQAQRAVYEPRVRESHPAPSVSARASRSLRAWVESIVLTLLFPAVGWLADRADPFFVKHSFPWIVFAPLLIGLRHGFAAGCTSASVLGGLLVLRWRTQTLGVSLFPAEPFLGLLALAMLTGQFSDMWRRDARRLGATLDLVNRRASEFARAHFLLELSHDRLEEQNARVPNLRDALAQVDRLAPNAGSWEALADPMMAIFATHAMLEVGTLVRVNAQGKVSEVVATLGRAGPVSSTDALLMEAVRSRALTHLPHGAPAEPLVVEQSRLLAAVPVTDSGGTLHAVLCVQHMPFVAFHKRNLEALAILAGHFADLVTRPTTQLDLERDRRTEFETRLSRALCDRREFGVPSVVAALSMSYGSGVTGIVDVIIAGSLRPRDATYRTSDRLGNTTLFMLLPMADESAGRVLQERVEGIVQRELYRSLSQAGATFAFCVVGTEDTLSGCLERLSQTFPGSP